MSALSFNPATHVYAAGSRVLPSVTEILRAVGIYDSYHFATRIHAFRGSAVHAGAAIIDMGGEPHLGYQRNGNAEVARVASEIPMYWDAYRSFKARTGFQGRIWECPMANSSAGYAGTFDAVGEIGDEVVLLDLKSGTLPDMVPVQLWAYADLIERGTPINPDHPGLPWLREVVKSKRPIRKMAVRLERDGKDTLFSRCPKNVAYDDPMWASAWRSVLNTFILRSNYGLLEAG